MITIVRYLSQSQWIMLMTIAAIASLLVLASRAEAFEPSYPRGTTLGHCGWVPAGAANYAARPRNVAIIQSKLESMGYSVGRAGVDGRYGRNTRTAVRHFQRDHYLSEDGMVGGETATRLAYSTHPIANVRKCYQPYF